MKTLMLLLLGSALLATSAFAGVNITINPYEIARTIHEATQSTPGRVYQSKPAATPPAQKKRPKSRSSSTPSPEPNAQHGRSEKYQPSQSPTGSGTGFFVSEDGFLLTNYHVIRNAQKVLVLQGDRELTAKTIVVDPSNDLAVLKVDSPSTPIPLGNIHNVVLGDSVMTIGFPNVPLQGRSPKLTKGEVNSLSGLQDDPRLFQTSVQIQPGNSGGPLLDEFGNAIGITQATLNPLITLKTGGSIPQNVNYAVKISYAELLVDTVPDLRNQLPPAATTKRDPTEVVSNACKSTVLILVWARNNSGT
jgi:S1-C subfamily serine protease